LVSVSAAAAVGPGGYVVGTDISGAMVESARESALQANVTNASFIRMDAEKLLLFDRTFDVALCALGLMYVPDPLQALREMRRVVGPGGRIGIAVWGERTRCGWSPVFPITEAEVQSDVCPLFFNLGVGNNLAALCEQAHLKPFAQHRIDTTLVYKNGNEACDAAFVGGPVALAWSRFDEPTRARARGRYLEAISPWRQGDGYRVPGEFVVIAASVMPEPRA
jgi:SAM-dependent methyltransferase